jgi:hypothetical protein
MSQENVDRNAPTSTMGPGRLLAALVTTVVVILALLIAPSTKASFVFRYCTKPYCVSVLHQDRRLSFKLKAFSVWGKHSRNYTLCIHKLHVPRRDACHHRQRLVKHDDFWVDIVDFRREFPNFRGDTGHYFASWHRGGRGLFPSLRFPVTPLAFVQALEAAGLRE